MVFPAPCKPTIITRRGRSSRNSVVPSPSNFINSSLMILTTCCPGETDFKTSCPMQAFSISSINSLTVRKWTSAESSAFLTSVSASLTFSSESLPTPLKFLMVRLNLSVRFSNILKIIMSVGCLWVKSIIPPGLYSLPILENSTI